MAQQQPPLVINVLVKDDSPRDICWKPNMTVWGRTKEEFLTRWQTTSKGKIEHVHDEVNEVKSLPEEKLSLADWFWKVIAADEEREEREIDQVGHSAYWSNVTRKNIQYRQTFIVAHPHFGEAFTYQQCDQGSKAIENTAHWELRLMEREEHQAFLLENEEKAQVGYLPGTTETFEYKEEEDSGDDNDDDTLEDGVALIMILPNGQEERLTKNQLKEEEQKEESQRDEDAKDVVL